MKFEINGVKKAKGLYASDLKSGVFFLDKNGDLNLKVDLGQVVWLSFELVQCKATPWIRDEPEDSIRVLRVIGPEEAVTLYSVQ